MIACLTPRYVVSHYCNKEIALADLLHKPIIPVMHEQMSWPPGGAMSLIFAQLVYVDLCCKFSPFCKNAIRLAKFYYSSVYFVILAKEILYLSSFKARL